jgi:hypothetical protein
MVPVILIVILMFPAWLTWPFLDKERRKSVLQMVQALGRWAMGDTSDPHDEGDQEEGDQEHEDAEDSPTDTVTSGDAMNHLDSDDLALEQSTWDEP